NIPLRVLRPCGKAELAEEVWARPSKAMLHSRDHEQAQEGVSIGRAHQGGDAVVVIDGAGWGNRRIAPAVSHDKFAAARFEGLQIRVGGVEIVCLLFISQPGTGIEVERFEVPGGIVKDHVGKEVCTKRELDALTRRRS